MGAHIVIRALLCKLAFVRRNEVVKAGAIKTSQRLQVTPAVRYDMYIITLSLHRIPAEDECVGYVNVSRAGVGEGSEQSCEVILLMATYRGSGQRWGGQVAHAAEPGLRSTLRCHLLTIDTESCKHQVDVVAPPTAAARQQLLEPRGARTAVLSGVQTHRRVADGGGYAGRASGQKPARIEYRGQRLEYVGVWRVLVPAGEAHSAAE